MPIGTKVIDVAPPQLVDARAPTVCITAEPSRAASRLRSYPATRSRASSGQCARRWEGPGRSTASDSTASWTPPEFAFNAGPIGLPRGIPNVRTADRQVPDRKPLCRRPQPACDISGQVCPSLTRIGVGPISTGHGASRQSSPVGRHTSPKSLSNRPQWALAERW
jgi:hypothetical protein